MLTLHPFINFFGSIVFGLRKIPHVFVGNPFGDLNPLFEIDNPWNCSSPLFRRFLSSLRSFGPSGGRPGAPFGWHDVKNDPSQRRWGCFYDLSGSHERVMKLTVVLFHQVVRRGGCQIRDGVVHGLHPDQESVIRLPSVTLARKFEVRSMSFRTWCTQNDTCPS